MSVKGSSYPGLTDPNFLDLNPGQKGEGGTPAEAIKKAEEALAKAITAEEKAIAAGALAILVQEILADGSQPSLISIDPLHTHATHSAAPLEVETLDHTGECIEPAVVYIPQGWNGHRWWAAISGATKGKIRETESACIYSSDDGINFTLVPGAPAPLIPTPPAPETCGDPDLVLGPDNNLHYFAIINSNNESAEGVTTVFHMESADGKTWSSKTPLLSFKNGVECIGAPMFAYDSPLKRWCMWYEDLANFFNKVKARYPLKRRTLVGTSPVGAWSAPTVCTVNGVPASRTMFDSHIRRYGLQWHLLAVLCDEETSGAHSDLHFATSEDGLTWTLNPTALLSRGNPGWDKGLVYRACGVPADSGNTVIYDLYYSAAEAEEGWHIGLTQVTVDTAGAWTKIALGAKTEESKELEEAGFQSIRARSESGGGAIRLRGFIQVKAGSELSPADAILTLPPDLRPPASCLVLGRTGAGTYIPVKIAASGVVSILTGTLPEKNQIGFDGITVSLT